MSDVFTYHHSRLLELVLSYGVDVHKIYRRVMSTT